MATEAPPPAPSSQPPPPAAVVEASPTPDQAASAACAAVDLPPKTDPSAPSQPPPQEEAAAVAEATVREAATSEEQKQAAQVKEGEGGEEKSSSSTAEATEKVKSQLENIDEEKKTFIQPAVSFKEESYFVSDLSDSERRALDELKKLVQEAIDNHTLCASSGPPLQQASSSKLQRQTEPEPEKSELNVPQSATTIKSALKQDQDQQMEEAQISIWGIPLLKDERTDVILLKFLRARDFRVNDAFAMIKMTLQWRVSFGIDRLLDEDLGDDLEKVVFMHGRDRDGHPVCYNVYGEFQNKELYVKTFSDEEKRARFLRWRTQFLERSIRKLDFRPGGINTIFQVNDLKNAPGPGKRELRLATRQALHLLQDNYPEFVAKQLFINVPWWYVAFYTMMSPFMTQRTKSKFVYTGPAKTADTLFKYISPEQVPIQYGGLSVDFCDCNTNFTVDDAATEIHVKPTTKQFVEILVSERCVILWELRVVGWEVTYSAEFAPSSEDKYTVIIQKATKMSSSDDPVVSGCFKISDLGKIVLTIDNPTFKRRKLIYRYKVMPHTD